MGLFQKEQKKTETQLNNGLSKKKKKTYVSLTKTEWISLHLYKEDEIYIKGVLE